MKRFWLRIIYSLMLLPLPLMAEVDVINDTTITLPSDGTSYTLTGDSIFDSFTVNSSSIQFTMSARQRVVLKSANAKKLTNSLNVNTTCSATESSVLLETSIDAATQTVTVTPSGSCSAAGGGSPGGGGGSSSSSSSSGSSASAQSSTSAVPSQSSNTLTELQQKLSELLKQVPSAAPAAIARNLARGSTGDDVRSLQRILSLDSAVYPQGIINGTFGPATQAAVGKFQEKYGIAKPGEAGYGQVGPKTRAKLNEASGGTQSQASSVPAASPANTGTGRFTRSLSLGMRSQDVTNLQTELAKDPDIYPNGLVSGYFGPATQAAVGKFQEKYGIAKPGEAGYGQVGPKTRAKLNEIAQ